MKARTVKKRWSRDVYECARAGRMVLGFHARWAYQARYGASWLFEAGLGQPVRPGQTWRERAGGSR